MRRLFLLSGLLLLVNLLSAQMRLGVKTDFPVVVLDQPFDNSTRWIRYPGFGLYLQRWKTDIRFHYNSAQYEAYAWKDRGNNNSIEKYTTQAWSLGAGWGWCLGRTEFEDDFVWFTTLGFSAGWLSFSANDGVDGYVAGIPYFSGEFTIGFEKKLARNYFLSPYFGVRLPGVHLASVGVRFTRSMYK